MKWFGKEIFILADFFSLFPPIKQLRKGSMFEQAAKRIKHEMGVLMEQHKKDEENPDRKK